MVNSKLDLLYGDWKWVENPEKYSFKKNQNNQTKIMNDAITNLLAKGWGGSSNLMIKTESFKKVGGCDENIFVQDYSIPLRIAGNHLKSNSSKQYKVAVTSKLICVCPKFITNRIMDNSGQTVYDLSIASLNFLDEHSLLKQKVKDAVLKKIVSRCWKWTLRKNGKSYFSKEFRIYLKSKFGLKYSPEFVRYFVYQTWRKEERIRKLSYTPKKKVKILIYVGLDLLGDALLKLPFLRTLKKVFPHSEVTWLAGKGDSILSKSLKPLTHGLLDKIEDKIRIGSKLSDISKAQSLSNFNIVIDTQKRVLTTLILKKINCDIFISQSANFFFSDLKPDTQNEVNLSKQLINLAEIFNYKKIDHSLSIKTNKSKKVVICPGASVKWKSWNLENFIEMANYILHKKFVPIFILGPKEKNLKHKLLKAFGKSKVFISNDPIKTMEFSADAKLGISNDTGCGHLIANAGIPLITIFGPTNSEKFRPIGNPFNKVISSVKEYGSNDINTIKPKLLIEEFNKLIKEVG
jgi:ADP-heptose:LPS heptosyltransferase